MQETIWREEELIPFSIDIDELEELISKFLDPFTSQKPTVSIYFKLKEKNLSFVNAEEIREYGNSSSMLPGEITVYDIEFEYEDSPENDGRYVHIKSGHSGSQATIRAYGGDEIWREGVINTVASFAAKHKTWYHWIYRIPLWLLPASLITGTMFLIMGRTNSAHRLFPLGLCAIAVIVLIFSVLKLLFHSSEIKISKQEKFIHRYSTEIITIGGALNIILALYGLFGDFLTGIIKGLK